MRDPRSWFRLVFVSCVTALVVILWVSVTTRAQDTVPDDAETVPLIGISSQNDVTPPLRELPLLPPGGVFQKEAPPVMVPPVFESSTLVEDAALDLSRAPQAIPAASRNFDGMGNLNGYYPPDTNGDVGLNHYVQATNVSLQMWTKDGTSVYGPANTNSLWQGFGGQCESRNDGDPVVLYDQFAQRWMITQFTTAEPYGECIAISTTSDPTGSYYRYFFTFAHPDQLYDYPHLGIWPVEGNNSIVLAANRFGNSGYAGASVIALDRAAMLNGLPARYVEFQPTNSPTYQPADLDGDNLPPAGSPAPVLGIRLATQLRMVKIKADWDNPENSTLSSPIPIAVSGFNFLCNGVASCIPQPDTTRGLAGLGDRLLQRLAYRYFETYDTMVIGHGVNVNPSGIRGGVRWYEIRDPLGATPTVYQQSTYSPDTTNRWMPSVAMDGAGNIATVFSESSGSVYPSVMYAGRLASDPLNTMGQGEAVLVAGTGSQTGEASRWGDYAAISTDPIDDCTFWMTTEYIATTSAANWRTRIGAFTFPDCLRLQSTVASQLVCQGQPASYPLSIQTGFGAAVTLSASGVPSPATVAFTQNPVSPPFPGASTATIGNTATAAPGIYNIVFRGTDGTIVDTALTQLTVLGATPLAPTLVAPVDRAVTGETKPTFTWAPTLGATNYTVDIATDPTFATIVQSATVSANSYTASPVLPINTAYYWRVRATTPCGTSAYSTPARFIPVGNVQTFARTGLNLAIPDNISTGVNDQVDIPPSDTLTDINVGTLITHTQVSDIRVRVISPANISVNLIDQPGLPGSGCTGDNIRATLDDEATIPVEGVCLPSGPYAIDGTYKPNVPIANTYNQIPAGTWTLNVTDRAGGNTGVLAAWSLQLTTISPADFSDLADSYGLAWHFGDGAVRLGSRWNENTLIPLPDSDNTDDDGVQVDPSEWVPNGVSTAQVSVTGGDGYVAAWFDWNQNGVFDNPSEQSIAAVVTEGINPLSFTVPATADLSQPVAMRFRLYTTAPQSATPLGFTADGEVEDYSDFAPPAIELTSLRAIEVQDGVDVRWVTAAETDTLGFNIWRSATEISPTLKLNATVIPSDSPGNGQGASYTWLDATPDDNQPYYWLESVDLVGNTRFYGPVEVEPPLPTAITLGDWSLSASDSRLPLVAGVVVLEVIGVVGLWRRRK